MRWNVIVDKPMEHTMENEEQQATLADTIRESIATVTNTEPTESATVETQSQQQPQEPKESKPGRTAGRARAADGKLLPGKAPTTDPAAEQQKPPLAVATPSATEAQPAVPAAVPPIQRPSSWKKDMWPLWDKMIGGETLTPQEARQVAEYNAQRETQFATGVSTYKQIADSAKPIMDAIAPFQQDLEAHGIQAPDMVYRLMSAHKQLATGAPQQKLQLFAQLAHDYGIPLQALYDQNAQQQFLATPHIPQQAPVQQSPDIGALVRQELENAKVHETVQSMASNVEKYPFFHYVRSDMAQLLETLEATDLEDAYEKALELPQHARLATVMQAQQTQASDQQHAANVQATVRAARANAVSPKSATPASAPIPDVGKKGVRSALQAAISQHVGGSRV
jgi:DNA-binding protein Fis